MRLPGFRAQFSLGSQPRFYTSRAGNGPVNSSITPSRILHRPLRFILTHPVGATPGCPDGWNCCQGPVDPGPCACIPGEVCGVAGGQCGCYDPVTGDRRPGAI